MTSPLSRATPGTNGTTTRRTDARPDVQATSSATPARPIRRPRRLRRTAAIRDLVAESRLTPSSLVLPLFLSEHADAIEPIDALPGCARLGVNPAVRLCRQAFDLGVKSFALFPAVNPRLKSPGAEHALDPDNPGCASLRALRAAIPEACLIADIALDPYSSIGHDGISDGRGDIANDATVDRLVDMAIVHAAAGADVVAPSDMMDGRVGAIRAGLDAAGFTETIILSYATKYASSLYGPFRAALDSAPVIAHGVPADKRTYQMNPANRREALVEARLDVEEGADLLMVKPASWYLDIVADLRGAFDVPIAAYQVSGEYAMIQAAAAAGWVDVTTALVESLTSIRRAGADVIFTYGALDYARWWHQFAN